LSQIAVIGGGYVGLVTSACFAKLGHEVVCVEVDSRRLASLSRGEIPIYEPGLEDLVHWALDTGRLTFTASYAEALPGVEYAFVCVNTPPKEDGSADVRNVFKAADCVVQHADKPLTLVIKSTVPVGTGDQIEDFVSSCLGVRQVVSNPEFLRQGSAIKDFLQPDRVVIGAGSTAAAAAVGELYSGIDCKVIFCSRRSAELAKYAANALLATRISFMNEIAALCSACNADVEEIASVLGSDRRIGPDYLKAGLGWGGSCFPKDVRALNAISEVNGLYMPIIKGAYATNIAQRMAAYDKIVAAVRDHYEPVVGILGLAFKPNTDDLREAPAMEIAQRLLADGISVRAHDPVAMINAELALPQLIYCLDPYHVADGADALFLATEWPQYLDLDWTRMATLMKGRVVIDGRNVLNADSISASGLDYEPFGRPMSLSAQVEKTSRWHAQGDLMAAS
jgi:UDPglucose 6-dehydrogenase